MNVRYRRLLSIVSPVSQSADCADQVDGPRPSVDPADIAGVQPRGAVDGAHDTRDPQLPRNDGGMALQTSDVDDQGARQEHHRRPAGIGERSDQDLAGLNIVGGGIEENSDRRLEYARTGTAGLNPQGAFSGAATPDRDGLGAAAPVGRNAQA